MVAGTGGKADESIAPLGSSSMDREEEAGWLARFFILCFGSGSSAEEREERGSKP